jgi:hypothetical protein
MVYFTKALFVTFGATVFIAAGFSVLEPMVEAFSNDILVNIESSIPKF